MISPSLNDYLGEAKRNERRKESLIATSWCGLLVQIKRDRLRESFDRERETVRRRHGLLVRCQKKDESLPPAFVVRERLFQLEIIGANVFVESFARVRIVSKNIIGTRSEERRVGKECRCRW